MGNNQYLSMRYKYTGILWDNPGVINRLKPLSINM